MRPVASAAAEPSLPNGPDASASGWEIFGRATKKSACRVLVVDDEPLIRWSVAESLAVLGVHVEQAADAATALRSVRNAPAPFGAVVMDLRLPDVNDLSLLEAMHVLLPRARLILMTAFGTPEIKTRAMRMGATVLEKPFELDDLSRIVVGGMPRPV